MFSNYSVKLVTLKNRFLMTAKSVHSIRMCLTVQVVWHVRHCGCGSCFSMKARVNLVWPIRSRDITTCSLLDALKAGLHSPKVDWICSPTGRMQWKTESVDLIAGNQNLAEVKIQRLALAPAIHYGNAPTQLRT